MAGKLLTDGQLLAMQKVAELGMQTEITIMRTTVDTGLDLTDDPYGSSVSEPAAVSVPIGGVKGWLHSTPTPMASVDNGRLITVNTYRLWLPIGTNILPRDRVLIGANTYVVTDTTVDSTWPALLNCSLRLAE